MRNSAILPILLLIAFIVSGCTPPAPAAPTGQDAPIAKATAFKPAYVKLSLGYIPSVQFAPFYVAIDQGYFVDENIAVELENGIETDFLKLLATNERQFVVASGDQVILGRSQGLPVNYVAAWYRQFPVVVFARADKNLAQPADLVGKKVGIPGPFGASYVAWKALVAAANLPEDQIRLESIGFTQAAAVSDGLVDAALDYSANGPVQLRLAGEEVSEIVIDDYARIPANGLLTNETTLKEQPELVQRMVRAMLRGIQYTLDHPDEAFDTAVRFVPEAAQQLETNRAIFDASLAIWQPAAGEKLGFTDPDTWSATAAMMAEAGLVDKVVPTDGIWTNEFVEAVAAP